MSGNLASRLYGLLISIVLLITSGISHAQNADALSIVVDQNGTVSRVNYQCDIQQNCPQTLQKISNQKVKAADAVAIGRSAATNYAFVANDWKHGSIELFVQRDIGSLWENENFSSDGASAMVVTRNEGTLFVARPYSATIEAYARTGGPEEPFVGYNPTPSAELPPLQLGWLRCLKIVGLEEYPAGSGDLIAMCALPSLAVHIKNPLTAPEYSYVDGSAVWGLSSGAVTTVPVGNESQDYLLLATGFHELIAVDLENGQQQRRLLRGQGYVRSTATALCNFFAPSNDTDNDEDVDGPCGVMTQSGGSGRISLFEIDYDPQAGELVANIREQVSNGLRNPHGIDFVNTGVVSVADCLEGSSAGGCQMANNFVTLALEGVSAATQAAFETQGPFTDPRYNSNTGTCERVELPLAFTNIPVLATGSIGPEFCARDGKFFIDIISAPDVTPTSGYTTFETPGACWVPGFDTANATEPATDLDGVEYGLLYGDEFDLYRNDGTNDRPGQPPAIYINNHFAQDNLVGCGSRVRAGGRLTFVIEDINGAMQVDLGNKDSAIGDNILYQYGNREANERINIPLKAVQSGCQRDLSTAGFLSGACGEHVVALNGGLAGWDMQRLTGSSTRITAANIQAVAGSDTATLPILGAGISAHVTTSPGGFSFRQAGGSTVAGITGKTAGEIDIGETMAFTASTTPRPDDLVLQGSNAVDVAVPFRADEVTLALFYDGPEFSDVQEVAQITAILANDTLTATLVNTAEDNSSSDTYAWNVTSSNGNDVSDLQNLSFTVLSGDNSASEYAIVQLNQPFGDRAIMTLEITALAGEESDACPSCNNQSDFALLDLTFAAVDRVQALAFAYHSYLEALCPVSTRASYSPTNNSGTRPKLCGSATPSPAAFNLVTAPPIASRNIAGAQQADVEGALRFIAHNICELDYNTDIDPAGIGFSQPGQFCRVKPEWSPTPAASP
ncbi:MAG TPA: hypothetical protein PKK10_06605 [Woeseiaceae bacterium]|nr:hypothetical protein [Woeseiaceae bacterium]